MTIERGEKNGFKNNFNSHAHVERDQLIKIYFVYCINFNSHAHVERDQWVLLAWQNFSISTHTLTWSVTAESCNVATNEEDFNSHAHVERDHLLAVIQDLN